MPRLQEEGSGPVHGFWMSTVGSARPTETGTVHQPTGLDLAMKLHYIKSVYIYSAETTRDLTVMHVKETFFTVLDQISWITGRLRRRDSGRPFIKCNDCGTRVVESQCDLTVDEWLCAPDRSVDESLVYHQPIGPELAYSPLIYIQVRVCMSLLIYAKSIKITSKDKNFDEKRVTEKTYHHKDRFPSETP